MAREHVARRCAIASSIAADPAERGGLEILVRAGDVAVASPSWSSTAIASAGAVLAVEHGGEIGARGGEAGRQLERAAQQMLGVGEAPEPRGQLGHHPDRGDVERLGLEPRAEDRLGGRQVVVDQRLAGADQLGIVERGGDRLRLGALGGVILAVRAAAPRRAAAGAGMCGSAARISRACASASAGCAASRRRPWVTAWSSGTSGRAVANLANHSRSVA